MPGTALVARVLDLLNEQGFPAGVDPDLFTAFIRAVGRQIRAPYQTRYTTAQVLSHLQTLYTHALTRSGADVLVFSESDQDTATFVSVMPDQPFVVDSVRLTLRSFQATYVASLNAVLHARRDAQGRLVAIGGEGSAPESVIRIEVEDLDEGVAPTIAAELPRALKLAQVMVLDFSEITEMVDASAFRFMRLADRMPDQAEPLRETADFLRWLLADNFVFMGAVYGDQRVGFDRAAIEEAGLWSPAGVDEGWAPSEPGLPVRVRKGKRESPVHRAGRIDEIRVDVPTERGGDTRPFYIQGMFTYRAVTQPSRHVPVLRRTLTRILSKDESAPGSYRYRGIANVFDSLPTEFLFTATPDEVAETVDRVLEAEQEQKVRVHIMQKAEPDLKFALVAFPKNRFSDKLRSEIQELLVNQTQVSYCDHGVFASRYDTMLLYYFLTGGRSLSEAELDSLRDRIAELSTPWEERVYAALTSRFGTNRGDELMIRYGAAFDDDYVRYTSTDRSCADIELIERLDEQRNVLCDVFVDSQDRINLRIYQREDKILSDILPVLDNFGLIVIDQYTNVVRPRQRNAVNVDTFRLKGVWGLEPSVILERAGLLIAGIEAVFANHMADDPLNRLLLRSGLPWAAVDLIRAYNGYARQLGLRYTLNRVQEILRGYPSLVGHLWAFFQARFDPSLGDERSALEATAREAFQDEVRQVNDHDQDVTFRTLFNLMESTVRTNFYRTDRLFHYISFKIDCSTVRTMPSPRMKFEIYVHHREVEGVHLRGGPIARGGIRWSDREDYRREIFGLASTQMVKNVLIVPEGAKGGFFIKAPGSRDPAVLRKRADELYKVLIRGLLDLTDNIVSGQIMPPPDVVRWDSDDPYLVVAADKGTAHLSDTANALSEAYGFWLGDAFASGGSQGYDHKKVGITARGAWMAVRRHFRETGMNPDTEEFTAIGIGDTSGDVFGNGVIETRKMRLLAAFNHLHVFLDPNPDAEATYQERLRLFNEAKGWEHYNKELLSPGGGIFDRRAKSIPLTPEVQQMLGVLQSELPVDAVLRLILRLDVDLLWNGGIGTYVKATHESHLDASDAANDEIRVNASELRCRIVAEGGNLGFTQAARIEFASKGGRINTDAIDNSGGVDLSDHEVNLKILLTPMARAGRMSWEARNQLLESLTGPVADAVLVDNDVHARQLSVDLSRSLRDPMAFSRTIDWVCHRSGRTRAELYLPSDDDLARRGEVNQGMTRPELAVLAAHVKMHIYKELMNDDESLIPGFEDLVVGYFPAAIQERFRDDLKSHMLYKNIGMTVVLTRVVEDAGALFFPTQMELTGASVAAIAGAWIRAQALAGADELRRDLKQSEASSEARYQAWCEINQQVSELVGLWLAPGEQGPEREDRGRISDVLGRIGKVRGAARDERTRAHADALVALKLSVPLAHRAVALEDLIPAREIALLPGDGESLHHNIIKYLAAGEASRILPALRALETRRTRNRWDPVAIGILRNRFLALLRQIVRSLPSGHELRLGVDRTAVKFSRGPLGLLQREMDQILGDQPDVATLLVAEERIRSFLARTSLESATQA